MGLLTFSEMQSNVRTMLGERAQKDALIMRGLQFAQHRISRIFAYEEAFKTDEVTVDDTGTGNELTDATITMPDTMRKLYAITIVDDTNITPIIGISKVQWEQKIADTTVFSRGRPTNFVQFFRTLYLWRVPSQEYTIRRMYTSWPTEITLNEAKDAPSNTTTKSDLDHKDEMLILSAGVWCYLSMNNRERANYLFVVLKGLLEEAGIFDNDQPATAVAVTKSVESFADHTVPTFG